MDRFSSFWWPIVAAIARINCTNEIVKRTQYLEVLPAANVLHMTLANEGHPFFVKASLCSKVIDFQSHCKAVGSKEQEIVLERQRSESTLPETKSIMDDARIPDLKVKCPFSIAASEQREHVLHCSDESKQSSLDSGSFSAFFIAAFLAGIGLVVLKWSDVGI